MKITYLGVEIGQYDLFGKWSEATAIFEVDFEINFKGTYSLGSQKFRVSLPCIGINDELRTVLSREEIRIAKSKIIDQIVFEAAHGCG